MANPPPIGTLPAQLAASEQPHEPLAAPTAPSKGEAPKARSITKPSFESEKISETKRMAELSKSQRMALKELILRVHEALNNHEFSAAPKETKPHIKAGRSPQNTSIWGVPLLKDDRTYAVLLKFLKAKNFDVAESFTMLKNTIRWRKEFGVDGPLDQLGLGDDRLQKAAYVHGHDKEGHPVFYNVYGEFRNKKLYMSTFGDEDKRMSFVRGIIQMLERKIRKFKFSDVGASSTFLMVVDLKNAPRLGKKEIESARDQLANLIQDNYPGFFEKQVFINVPLWYVALNSLIRPFLPDHTKRTFDFARPSKAVDILLKYISPENLPVQYGGFNGGYPHIPNPEFTADDRVTEVKIQPRNMQTFEIYLDKKCAVSLEARVVGWGVRFHVVNIPDDRDAYDQILHKYKKMNGQDGVVSCYKVKVCGPGRIVLAVDNATSKWKRLMYRFNVEPFQD